MEDAKRPVSTDDLVYRGLIVISLVMSGGTGVLTKSTFEELEARTKDRYFGRDAGRDFALRDQRIERNRDDIVEIKARLDKIPPPEVRNALDDHEDRLRAIEGVGQ